MSTARNKGGHIRKNNKPTQNHYGQRITTLKRTHELRRSPLLGLHAGSAQPPQNNHPNLGGFRVRSAKQGECILLGRGCTGCIEDRDGGARCAALVMWILPKQLHTLDFVPDTEALNLDLNEFSQLCAQLLFVRSKPSRVPTWLRKWKRDTWTQHLFGRILNPSHGKTFVTAWTSSLVATHASHLAQQASDLEEATPDISGHGSQMELFPCDLGSVSLKTLKDTLVLDSEKLSKNWKDLVTKRRGEYLARAKLARHNSVSGSLFWPTVTTAEGGKIGCQANFGQVCLSNHPAIVGLPTRLPGNKSGRPCQASHSTSGSRQESWATPRANKTEGYSSADYRPTLNQQIQRQATGKLNPRWVETLMGLPIGWTMPSCSYPVTIEPTSCDYLATESCQPQQSELF